MTEFIYSDICVVVDDKDNPYGTIDSKDGSGYLKPTHLQSHPVVIQQKGILVASFFAQVYCFFLLCIFRF